ncbi:MAG TPA: anti-sigma factor [Acidimicrobiales bacterium]|nr:anti-sigma factor [Acidimicrobiales bacterium]
MTTARDQHHQVSDLLGPYALDAVDAEEAARVKRHLEECHRCRAEVDQLREVAAALGNTAEPPPEHLWDRIADRLGSPAGELGPGARYGERAGLAAAGASPLPPALERAGPPRHSRNRARPRGARQRHGRRAWTAAAMGTAAACAALAVVLGIDLSNANGRVAQLQTSLARQGPAAAVAAALASPGHRVVELHADDGARLAELVVQRNGVGYVVASSMAGLPDDETYQLWAKIAGQPISLGLLGSTPRAGAAFSLGTSVGEAQQLMVTVEPAGGVVTPDRGPVASATLS